MTTRALPIILCIAALGAATASAQQRGGFRGDPARDLVRVGDMMFAEAVVLPPDSSGTPRVDVLVRVAWDFIVFTRTSSVTPDSLFAAGCELSIDIQSVKGGAVASSADRIRVRTNDYESTNARDRFVLLRRSFSLAPGDYSILVQAADAGSTRTRELTLQVRVRAPGGEKTRVLSAVACDSDPSDTTRPLVLRGFGGSVPFAKPATFAVIARADADARWEFRLLRPHPDQEQDTLALVRTAPVVVRGAPSAPRVAGEVRGFTLPTDGTGPYATLLFSLPFDTVDVGAYTLEIRMQDDEAEDTLRLPCRVLWHDMPLSLRDLQFTTSVMRYVLTTDEIDSLSSGSDAARERWLRGWWKRHDPTPATPYNEHMAEYFRRVDQAYFRFQTMTVPNGALTDRGKIFILYGEPETVQRVLAPDSGSQEIWSYPSLHKVFTFTDRNRNGNLRLAP